MASRLVRWDVGAEEEAHAAAVVVAEAVGVAEAAAPVGPHRAELGPGQPREAELELHREAARRDPRLPATRAPEDDRPPADRGERRGGAQAHAAAHLEPGGSARRPASWSACRRRRRALRGWARARAGRRSAPSGAGDRRRRPLGEPGPAVEALDDLDRHPRQRRAGGQRQAPAVGRSSPVGDRPHAAAAAAAAEPGAQPACGLERAGQHHRRAVRAPACRRRDCRPGRSRPPRIRSPRPGSRPSSSGAQEAAADGGRQRVEAACRSRPARTPIQPRSGVGPESGSETRASISSGSSGWVDGQEGDRRRVAVDPHPGDRGRRVALPVGRRRRRRRCRPRRGRSRRRCGRRLPITVALAAAPGETEGAPPSTRIAVKGPSAPSGRIPEAASRRGRPEDDRPVGPALGHAGEAGDGIGRGRRGPRRCRPRPSACPSRRRRPRARRRGLRGGRARACRPRRPPRRSVSASVQRSARGAGLALGVAVDRDRVAADSGGRRWPAGWATRIAIGQLGAPDPAGWARAARPPAGPGVVEAKPGRRRRTLRRRRVLEPDLEACRRPGRPGRRRRPAGRASRVRFGPTTTAPAFVADQVVDGGERRRRRAPGCARRARSGRRIASHRRRRPRGLPGARGGAARGRRREQEGEQGGGEQAPGGRRSRPELPGGGAGRLGSAAAAGSGGGARPARACIRPRRLRPAAAPASTGSGVGAGLRRRLRAGPRGSRAAPAAAVRAGRPLAAAAAETRRRPAAASGRSGVRSSGAGTTPAPTQAAAPPAVPAQIASSLASPAIPAPRAPPRGRDLGDRRFGGAAAGPAAASAGRAAASWARSSSERDARGSGGRARDRPRRRAVGAHRRPAVSAGAQVLAQDGAVLRRPASPSQKAESSGRSSAQRPPLSLRERKARKRSRPSARQRLTLVRL